MALNACAVKHKFKSDAATEAAESIEQGDYFCDYDVQDFFPHVAVLEHFRNHHVFRHIFVGENTVRWYRFIGLPFGLHDSLRARSCGPFWPR